MLKDLDFHPERQEEELRRQEEAELARRVRREVLRVQSGEAEEDLAADREAEEAQREAEAEAAARRERRQRNPFYRLVSGTILVGERATRSYPYLLTIAAMFLIPCGTIYAVSSSVSAINARRLCVLNRFWESSAPDRS